MYKVHYPYYNICSVDARASSASTKKSLKKDGKQVHAQAQVQEPDIISHDEKLGMGPSDFTSGSLANVVRVRAVFYGESLEQIKFLNNRCVPRDILQIVGLAAEFQVQLTSVTINKGMDKGTIYELAKVLQKSNINDLNFDDAFCQEGCYDLLLEQPSKLKSLSLARCKIEDSIVIKIAERLVHTATGSQTLSILNLSSNRITNEGVRALSDALRSNRSLSYLNLANNWIDDDGALSIVKVLQPFLLKCTEIQAARKRRYTYLSKCNSVLLKTVKSLKSGEPILVDKGKKKHKVVGKKGRSPTEDDFSFKAHVTLQEDSDIFADVRRYAKNSIIWEFEDPFCNTTMVVDGLTYCNGNYALAYLNLAYNNLSYCVLEPFVSLLKIQRTRYNKGNNRGLISVVLEGNPLPANCKEIKDIEYYIGLQTGMEKRVAYVKRPSVRRRASTLK